MRGNTHFVVPAAKFRLQAGADESVAVAGPRVFPDAVPLTHPDQE